MKTHLVNKKQKPLQSIVLVVMLVLSSLIGKAQVRDDINSIEVQITNDVLNYGVGIASLYIDDSYLDELFISWYYDDYVTGESSEYHNVLSIDHLHRGMVSVFVSSVSCNKLIYETFRYVDNETLSFQATINVTTNTQSCENVSADLTVVVNGGVPPYDYSWGSNHITVYEPGYYSCEVTDSYNNICTAEVEVSMKDLQCAHDPNEIFGPLGFGDEMMIATTQRIPYTITFENDPDFATAPASRVEIDYPIPAGQKIASFRLGDFGFGQFVFTVPSNTSTYYQRLDVSDSLGVWVDVTAGIDVLHNRAFWIFQSIDPSTGSEPQSSQLGFLLINDDLGRGEGYVSYNILPADGLHTGDTTAAVATIVFDDNAPIGTNVWTNEFDAVAPTSTIASANIIETDSTNCIISFSSEDDLNGSGVHSIELFVSVNGAQYVSVGSYAPELEVTYHLMNGSYYEFISIATDNVGNVEDFKTIPDAVIDFGFAPTDITLSKYYFYENDMVGSIVGVLNTIDLGDVFTYQLVDGEGATDNGLFAIFGNTLVTNTDFNCEERLDYSVRVRSTDVSDLYIEKAFDISMVKTNQTYDLNYEGDVCQGEDFIGYGWNINLLDTVPGTYTYTRALQTISGCDSIRMLTLTIHPVYSTQITDEVVVGEDYTSNGFYIINPPIGIIYDTLYLQTTQGCDSIVSLTLTVNPEVIYYTQTNTLTSGWNWWSSYITMSTEEDFNMVKDALGANASMIKSRNDGFVTYMGDWYGTLQIINNQSMYMINMNSEQTISIIGTLANLASNPITINNGWNWIGFPSNVSVDINSALANMSPMETDLIKTRNAFATYYSSLGGWFGTLTSLTPGMGYMYQSNNTESFEFTYSTSSREDQVSQEVQMTNHWEVSVGEYSDNATLIGVIAIDGEEQRDENLIIGAFIDDRCVGEANAIYVEPFDRYLVFLTYFGNENDEITFRLYDENSGIETIGADNSLAFNANSMIGSVEEPLVINFATTTKVDEFVKKAKLFPNPVKTMEKVNVDLKNIDATSMKIEIVNTLGVVVYQHSYNTVVTDVTAPCIPGIYIVRITLNNGNVYYGKLIVE